jgi:hypothetical protein
MFKCKRCGLGFSSRPKAHSQVFCSKRCREKDWANNNRDRLNAGMRRYRARRYEEDGRWLDSGPKARALKEWMVEIKSKPCHDCGGSFPVCCMDFDHRHGTAKEYNVGSMFAHHYARELIGKELEKCDLVCANCHRVRTRDRSIGKRKRRV